MRLWSTEFVSPQVQWVCTSPSIHISCRWYPWILVCFLYIQSLLLARLTAKKMPLFPLLLFFPLLLLHVVVTQGSVPQIVCYANSGILCSSLVVICFLCYYYIAGLRSCIQSQVFGCRFGLLVLQWSTWSYCILFWHLSGDLSDLAHHAWEEEPAIVFLDHIPLFLYERELPSSYKITDLCVFQWFKHITCVWYCSLEKDPSGA